MDTNGLHNIDLDIHGILHLAGRPTLRQIRCDQSRSFGIPSRWQAWTMRMHYCMWIAMAISFIVFGMLWRGREDMIIQQNINAATAAVFMSMPIKSLTEYKI